MIDLTRSNIEHKSFVHLKMLFTYFASRMKQFISAHFQNFRFNFTLKATDILKTLIE